MAINKHSPIPRYYQLAELISEQIRLGQLQPGGQLPSERDLSEQHGISRMTVRQAINYLVREGNLVTHHGLGTFVAQPKLTTQVSHLLGFTEAIMRRGGKVASHVLEQIVMPAPPRIAAGLQIAPMQQVVKIVRLRLGEDVPLLLETSYLPYTVCPGMEHEDLAHQSLYAVLRERFEVSVERASQTLEATGANTFEAQLFTLQPGAPMVLLEGVASDRHKRPIEYFKAVYRADRFKFAFSSERNPALNLDFEPTHISVVLATA
jgi:GntR family transcriptional regulator